MYDTRTLTYPNGSKLIRVAKKFSEIWVYENTWLWNTVFEIDITEWEGVVINGQEELLQLTIGNFSTVIVKLIANLWYRNSSDQQKRAV